MAGPERGCIWLFGRGLSDIPTMRVSVQGLQGGAGVYKCNTPLLKGKKLYENGLLAGSVSSRICENS